MAITWETLSNMCFPHRMNTPEVATQSLTDAALLVQSCYVGVVVHDTVSGQHCNISLVRRNPASTDHGAGILLFFLNKREEKNECRPSISSGQKSKWAEASCFLVRCRHGFIISHWLALDCFLLTSWVIRIILSRWLISFCAVYRKPGGPLCFLD